MIKFDILSEDNAREFVDSISSVTYADKEELSEIIYSFCDLSEDGDIEIGLTIDSGCLLARIFDMGRYMFVFPIELTVGSDPLAAVESIREYAVAEELPLVITDIPGEYLGSLAPKFNHTVIDAEQGGQSFRLEARSECALLEAVPELDYENISLTAISEDDAADMARLNRDKELNKYWGYDVFEDAGEVSDGYFAELADREFAYGSAITLAVRAEDKYLGELILYGFDLSGCCEVGVRILPEHQGKGYGGLAILAAMELGANIGLSKIKARADERNIASVKMLSSRMDETYRACGKIFYEKEL